MDSILVDSNILIDLFDYESQWHEWSKEQLRRYGNEAILAINPIIYAEISLHFQDEERLDKAISPSLLRRDPLPWQAAFIAARAFLEYRKSGGIKTSIMPDFFIGAHALVKGMKLLTRDVRRYKTYFPGLELVCP
jgi:predicted nucleic acid-binding protein